MSIKIAQDKIEEVRLASDIVEVISGYVTLRKRGKNYFGLCPFHTEKTPSFSVNPDLQIFHCFGCKVGGNVFSFIMKIENVSFPEAVRILAQAAGIILPEPGVDESQLHEKEALYYVNKIAADFFKQNLFKNEQGAKGLEYLKVRGMGRDIAEKLGLGFSLDKWDGFLNYAKSQSIQVEQSLKAGLIIEREGGGYYDRFRGRIMFPIRNLTGQVVAFGARKLVQDDSPKYINSPETPIYQKRFILYGLYQSREKIRSVDNVIVVEGYTDWISLHWRGLVNVVATSGTALTDEQAKLLRRYTTNSIILYDSDSAGAAAAMRGAEVLMENGLEVKIALMPSGHDPDSYIREYGVDKMKVLLNKAVPFIEFKLKNIEQSGGLSTSTLRAEATRSLLESISRVKDPIRRSFLVKDLAEKLKMDESILWGEVKRLSRRIGRVSQTRFTNAKPQANEQHFSTKVGAAELGLVEVLVQSPSLIKPISEHIAPDEIKHATIRNIIRHIYELESQGEHIEPAILSHFMDDPSCSARLAEIASRQVDSTDRRKLAEDFIRVIKLSKVVVEIAQLRAQIREAQSSAESRPDLLIKRQELLQKQKDLESGSFLKDKNRINENSIP